MIKSYCADLNDIEIDIEKKPRLLDLRKELRTLLRAKANLAEAQYAIRQLERQLRDKTGVNFEYANRALFAYAISLYGACFVRGGADCTIPLDSFLDKLMNSDVHKTIMTYRYKLISHLDENHDLRTDELEWNMTVTESGLIPEGPNLAGVKVLLTIGTPNWAWIEYMQMIIDLIEERKNEASTEVNTILGRTLISE